MVTSLEKLLKSSEIRPIDTNMKGDLQKLGGQAGAELGLFE